LNEPRGKNLLFIGKYTLDDPVCQNGQRESKARLAKEKKAPLPKKGGAKEKTDS
jgi:hypothetical protein